MFPTSATENWLRLIAIVSIVELTFLLLAVGVAYWGWRRLWRRVEELEATYVGPLASGARDILDDARDVSTRVQRQAARAEHTLDQFREAAGHARLTVARSRPAAALKAIGVAMASLKNGRRASGDADPGY
jgi:hypothetical protein